jgi:hypothetical protein
VDEDDGAILTSNDVVTISKTSAVSRPASFTATVSGGYTSVLWYVSGFAANGDEDGSIIINATNYAVGKYRLDVTVSKGGKPYSTFITFTVVE